MVKIYLMTRNQGKMEMTFPSISTAIPFWNAMTEHDLVVHGSMVRKPKNGNVSIIWEY